MEAEPVAVAEYREYRVRRALVEQVEYHVLRAHRGQAELVE